MFIRVPCAVFQTLLTMNPNSSDELELGLKHLIPSTLINVNYKYMKYNMIIQVSVGLRTEDYLR